MRDPSPGKRTWLIVVGLVLGASLAACASPPHLQRPLTFREGTVMPAPIAAAERAIAEAKAAGAANVQDARYPLAKAEAFLLNAKEEFAEGDPTDEIARFANIALQAAQEALRIARAQRR
jgi:hypothetical protein